MKLKKKLKVEQMIKEMDNEREDVKIEKQFRRLESAQQKFQKKRRENMKSRK